MATLTKKHFEATAETIRQIRNEKNRTAEMEKAITGFLKSNPRFDQERFRKLCEKEKPAKYTMPPGVSYQHLVTVDTSEWFPDPHEQFNELWRVTYKGVTYDLHTEDGDCRKTNYYSNNHAWKGQVESHTLDYQHVFEQFVGRKPEYNCGKTERTSPDCRLNEFLMNFLFNVKGCEDIEGDDVYQCCMTFTVEASQLAVFEKDLAYIAGILRAIKYEFEKDMPPPED